MILLMNAHLRESYDGNQSGTGHGPRMLKLTLISIAFGMEVWCTQDDHI